MLHKMVKFIISKKISRILESLEKCSRNSRFSRIFKLAFLEKPYTSAFGKLVKRLWSNNGITLGTKIDVYRATVLTSLLYGCETWTLSSKQIDRLEKFHLSTLRKIARIRWFHKVTNYEVLSRCKINSLKSMLDKAKLRWLGHGR